MQDPTIPTKTTQKTGPLPRAEMDLLNVCKSVQLKWSHSPQFKLIWTNEDVFRSTYTSYETNITEGKHARGVKSPAVNALDNLSKEIDLRIGDLKAYIAAEYGAKNAAAYYSQFGIVRYGTGYIIPRDRDDRQKALEVLIQAIGSSPFKAKPYGADYWQGKLNEYNSQLNLLLTSGANISQTSGDKSLLKKELLKTLNALVSLVKANYPDSYKAELRVWGFHKEKY